MVPDAAVRLNELARQVGVGGQLAIVVDGRVVAAQRGATPSLPAQSLVDGLDEDFARRLVDRLRK